MRMLTTLTLKNNLIFSAEGLYFSALVFLLPDDQVTMVTLSGREKLFSYCKANKLKLLKDSRNQATYTSIKRSQQYKWM